MQKNASIVVGNNDDWNGFNTRPPVLNVDYKAMVLTGMTKILRTMSPKM